MVRRCEVVLTEVCCYQQPLTVWDYANQHWTYTLSPCSARVLFSYSPHTHTHKHTHTHTHTRARAHTSTELYHQGKEPQWEHIYTATSLYKMTDISIASWVGLAERQDNLKNIPTFYCMLSHAGTCSASYELLVTTGMNWFELV